MFTLPPRRRCITIIINWTVPREIKGKKIAENFEQHVVVTKNISRFIDEVVQSRVLDVNTTLIRIELGGGGGFIKISVILSLECDRMSI